MMIADDSKTKAGGMLNSSSSAEVSSRAQTTRATVATSAASRVTGHLPAYASPAGRRGKRAQSAFLIFKLVIQFELI
jgi:hypothetical protein